MDNNQILQIKRSFKCTFHDNKKKQDTDTGTSHTSLIDNENFVLKQ